MEQQKTMTFHNEVDCIHIGKDYKCQNTEQVKNTWVFFRPTCPVAYYNGCEYQVKNPKPDDIPPFTSATEEFGKKETSSIIITVDTP